MRARRPIPDQSVLQSIFHYNPDTGEFTRIVDRRKWKAGQSMGTPSVDGYLNISVNYVIYRAQRLAWTYMTGEQPPAYLDHINGDRSDNRWANLREATQSQNLANMAVSRGKTGLKGVIRLPNGRFRARFKFNKRVIEVGCYATAEEAKAAYDATAKVFHGEYFRA